MRHRHRRDGSGCGTAACWAGGALGLVDHAVAAAKRKGSSPHRDARIGALLALAWNLEALRHRVERAATEVIDLHGRTVGPRALIEDTHVIGRIAQLQLYVRQHHDESDLEAIASPMHAHEPVR